METISLKLESNFLKEIDKKLANHRYSTRTEFIRDAIRGKISDLEKEEILKELAKIKGMSKKKTSDGELHRVGEEVFNMIEKKFSK